jgi:DNA-binding response OmpR family regulator
MAHGAEGRVAVVDDEESVREPVRAALEREGFAVELHEDGASAWERFGSGELPDVVVLDILMPRMDGLELCRKLRGVSETLPIIFLTSKDDELDRVLGLELGADDYLCKPFSVRELVARVRVLFRRIALLRGRGTEAAPETLCVEDLVLDLEGYTVRWNEVEIPLTVTEFLILRALARRPGQVKTRRQLMEEGYPHDAFVSERTIDSHIKRIRRKFEDVDPGFGRVETVHGLGYRYRRADAGANGRPEGAPSGRPEADANGKA